MMERPIFGEKIAKYILVFLLVLVCSWSYTPFQAFACSCAEPSQASQELQQSSAVFSGKVVDIVDKKSNKDIQSSADLIAIQFNVKEIWKRINQKQVVVYTERSGASCGFEFGLGKEYIVFAHEKGGDFMLAYVQKQLYYHQHPRTINN
ncbi:MULTISPECIES: hypothetical protein [Bacillus]|uniref:hypothetical protein n=1 Tax=Bacillus TaxID=1386 RepID=UPI0002E26578|nr:MULTISPECIES: hypothetical protein [Bacillus]